MDKAELKAKGLQHYKGKKRNKGKPGAHKGQVSSSTEQPPSPRVKSSTLLNRYDRYDQEKEERKISSSTDFSILASAPITHGSHFQFKSDKNIAKGGDLEASNFLNLFNLDLNLLNRSLSTIPFNIRCGINENYFTDNQHQFMNSTAKENTEAYVCFIKNHPLNLNPVMRDMFGSDNDLTQSESSSEESFDNSELIDDDSLKKEIVQNDSKVVKEKQNEDSELNLEQWLDDILDD